KATRQKHVFKVRNILINRLDQNYFSRIDKVKDPMEILNKIKEIKRYKALQHRNHDAIPYAKPLSDKEKRDAPYNANIPAIPQLQFVKFWSTNLTGKSLTYDQLITFIRP
ncbi:hypothetical protein M0802_014747, partial [Mischocyttarus mexicanus]